MLTFARDHDPAQLETDSQAIVDSDVVIFGELLIGDRSEECIQFVDALRAKGVSLQSVFLNLFATTARWLGRLWTEDLRSFSEVTIALGTLQQVFRHYSVRFEGPANVDGGRRAFLVPAPGEEHTFGLFVVETFLHRAGWLVDTLPSYDEDEVRAYLRHNTVQLIGISQSCERFLEGTRTAISMIRNEVAEHDAVVMAGGRLFNSHPKLVGEIGADAMARDADDAVRMAAKLVPWPIGDEIRRRIN